MSDAELLALSDNTQAAIRDLQKSLTTEEQNVKYITMCVLLIELINTLGSRE